MQGKVANPRFSIRGRVKSFRFAIAGIATMLRSQHNAWLHVVATAFAVLLGLTFQISRLDWSLLILAIIAVWVAEALNTALEFLCNVASPEFHPLVEKAKDVAAGGVLLSAIGALLIGTLIFSAYI